MHSNIEPDHIATQANLLQDANGNKVILELGTLASAEIESKMGEIKEALASLSGSTKKYLQINSDNLTEQQAQILLDYLKAYALFSLEITLPERLQNTRIQIELDNLISKHLLEQNKKRITSSEQSAPRIVEAAQKRSLPKKIKPKIEITLYEESTEETPKKERAKTEVTSTKASALIQPPKLERAAIAEPIINKLLMNPAFKAQKEQWEQITNRKEAQEFRKSFFATTPAALIKDHPIHSLLAGNPRLQEQLTDWTKKLNLGWEHYNALMDVIGQYDTAGLERLFQTWEFDKDPEKTKAFEETHKILLQYMPSYLPFLENTALNETISKIGNLSAEKRSWWLALLKNHVESTKEYTDLPYLFKCFTEATVLIEEMNLPFYTIKTIVDKKDLPTALDNIIALLKKCSASDRTTQWMCMSQIKSSKYEDNYFIIPEMQLEKEHPPLEQIKTILKTTPNSDVALIIPAFYRYIASQKQHLPLEKYATILKELCSDEKLNNENKLRMIYVLAITTSTHQDKGFNPDEVYNQWKVFQKRTIDLEYIDRIVANRDAWIRPAFKAGLYTSAGGNEGIRNKFLTPIMEMNPIPPMSYLNKLLTLSEYKFLDQKLAPTEMQQIQMTMSVVMQKAATLYAENPDEMSKAIRFIKTETVKINKDGKYFPDPNDISLLEKFVDISTLLREEKELLPLLTIFHLEYQSKQNLEQVISRYKKRFTASEQLEFKDLIQNLLPYTLSLLHYINNRENPKRLDINVLDAIQNQLLEKICTQDTSSKISSKKQVREWLHANYKDYFDGNTLLDIKDEVNFNALFDAHQCQDINIRRSIETLVSNFDEEEEKGYHEELAIELIKLTKSLTPEQSTQFFEYCKEALKTDAILSRNKQDKPPSYLEQFRTLVRTLTSRNTIAEFEQFLFIAQEHRLRGGTDRNNVEKYNYLINTLLPKLLEKKGIDKKEAFNFAANLLCQSPLQEIQNDHALASISSSEDERCTELLNNLLLEISIFNTHQTPENIEKVGNKFDAVMELAPYTNTQYTSLCKANRILINKILDAIAKRNEEQRKANFFSRIIASFKDPYIPALTEDEKRSLVDAGLFTGLVNQTNDHVRQLENKRKGRFEELVTHLYTKKEELKNKYPNISNRATDFIAKALSLSPEDISKNHNETCQLIDDLIALDDQNLVLSLMYHYAGGLDDRRVNDLVELLNKADYKALTKELKKEFIHIIISQMNNSVLCTKTEISSFLSFISKNKTDQIVMGCMHDFYQQAPYPSLEKFMLWTKDEKDREAINKKYAEFDKNPCAIDGHDGREKENGFKRADAKNFLKKMPDLETVFSSEYLDNIEADYNQIKYLTTETILEELKTYKTKAIQNHIRLVMLSAEMLHRSKGKSPEFLGEKQTPGNSFELNTTQIMAILAMLETGKKVTAEIGTGEGKTRILMLINACQFLKGNTVDFLTSNFELAERDYIASLPFFKSLGAEVNFITATSKIEDYKINGINVSDPANLCLFRRKGTKSKNTSTPVINPDPKKRSLTLDEADVTFFDVSNTKYNYASKTPEINVALIPLYPLIMEFFALSKTEEIYRDNKKRCNEQLLDFIEARNPDLFHILKEDITQLEKLQDAAYIARHLEYNVDYSIVSEATSPTELGSKKVAAAKCLIGSRIDEHAKFSDGVHSCLHAELNRLMTAPDPDLGKKKPYLKEILEKCKNKGRLFPIEPLREVTSTTSTHTMLKDYNKGNLMAVTGTIGSAIEQKEAKAHFQTQFIQIPRHKGMHRYDRPIVICDGIEDYYDSLVASIIQAYKKKEPTLIICKDDNQSRELYEALRSRIKSIKSPDQIGLIHAATNSEDLISETTYIKDKAGLSGQVTISTNMIGRGVDIKPPKEGLRVLHAYLPQDGREYQQGVGRSGRYGQRGTTQTITTVEAIKDDFGIDCRNADFYLNPEAFIRSQQIFSSITKKLHRLFSKSFDDLLECYTQTYEQNSNDSEESLSAWSHFLEQMNTSMEKNQNIIEEELQKEKPDINRIEESLASHCAKAKELWDAFSPHLSEYPELKKPKELDNWLTALKKLQAKGIYEEEVIEEREIKIHEFYSAVNEGRATVLQNPGPFVPNLIKWWKGEGKLFPNLQAWWTGVVEFGDVFGRLSDFRIISKGKGFLFPNFRAWISGNMSFRNMISQWPIFRYFIEPVEETHKVKIKMPSTYAFFLKNQSKAIENEESLSDDESPAPEHHAPLFSEHEGPVPEDTKKGNEAEPPPANPK